MPAHTVTANYSSQTNYGLRDRDGQRSIHRVRSRAPLRLGLAGGGTDVSPYSDTYGGIVLNATIDRYCYATLEQTSDGAIEFRAPDLELDDPLTPGLQLAGSAPLDLHQAIYERLTRDFDLGRPGIRVTRHSEM